MTLKDLMRLLIVLLLSFESVFADPPDSKEKCDACVELVNNFKAGLVKTAKENFGGGNTKWEETRLGSFATSETRLVHIVENVCESSTNKNLCHSLVEQWEEALEKWWFSDFKASRDAINSLYAYLCVKRAKICCPSDHFGPQCSPCLGITADGRLCSGHGSCNGNGTREGTGNCDCNTGYRGALCDDCNNETHYKDETECQACHESCADGCTGGGPEKCHKCRSGWSQADSTAPCVDEDECAAGSSPCLSSQYCENTPGSYHCPACDRACEGCRGPGPTNCTTCANGFQLAGEVCEDVNECSADSGLCRGAGEVCRNTPGSYSCDCAQGYQRVDSACVVIPSPPPSSTNSKTNSKSSRSTDAVSVGIDDEDADEHDEAGSAKEEL